MPFLHSLIGARRAVPLLSRHIKPKLMPIWYSCFPARRGGSGRPAIIKKLLASTILATAIILATGIVLAADLTREQITNQVKEADPDSTVARAVLEHKGGQKVWVITIKDSSGKESTKNYNAETGIEMPGKEIK